MREPFLAPHVARELDAQSRALSERVAASGLYTHETTEFTLACAAYSTVASRLGLAADLGSLTTPESRNVVRKVRLADGSLAVAKIVGNTREPGEAEVLALWHKRGLPCAEPLEWGHERVEIDGRRGVTTYLLTRFVEGAPLPAATTEGQMADQVGRLLELIAPFHRSGAFPPRVRRWEQRMRLHMRWTLPPLRQADLPEPDRWQETLERLSSEGHTLVHGDPAGGNVLETTSQGLLLLDPPGALLALREADVAQICAQVGGVDKVAAMVELACARDRTLDPAAVSAFAGLNFLTWAGYFVVDHPTPDAKPSDDGVLAAHRYIEVSRQLLEVFEG